MYWSRSNWSSRKCIRCSRQTIFNIVQGVGYKSIERTGRKKKGRRRWIPGEQKAWLPARCLVPWAGAELWARCWICWFELDAWTIKSHRDSTTEEAANAEEELVMSGLHGVAPAWLCSDSQQRPLLLELEAGCFLSSCFCPSSNASSWWNLLEIQPARELQM